MFARENCESLERITSGSSGMHSSIFVLLIRITIRGNSLDAPTALDRLEIYQRRVGTDQRPRTSVFSTIMSDIVACVFAKGDLICGRMWISTRISTERDEMGAVPLVWRSWKMSSRHRG
jgi:hypothetical protein